MIKKVMYKKTEQFMIDSFTKANSKSGIIHHLRTAYWLKKLKPDASEALLIAGVSHDIERAFYGDWKKGSTKPNVLEKHQKLSAEIVEKFLRSVDAKEDLIENVKKIILHHEYGGTDDSDLLKDADCLAFFEKQAMRHVKKAIDGKKTKQEVEDRLNFVFNKIKSKKAKEIGRLWYNKVIEKLKISTE